MGVKISICSTSWALINTEWHCQDLDFDRQQVVRYRGGRTCQLKKSVHSSWTSGKQIFWLLKATIRRTKWTQKVANRWRFDEERVEASHGSWMTSRKWCSHVRRRWSKCHNFWSAHHFLSKLALNQRHTWYFIPRYRNHHHFNPWCCILQVAHYLGVAHYPAADSTVKINKNSKKNMKVIFHTLRFSSRLKEA